MTPVQLLSPTLGHLPPQNASAQTSNRDPARTPQNVPSQETNTQASDENLTQDNPTVTTRKTRNRASDKKRKDPALSNPSITAEGSCSNNSTPSRATPSASLNAEHPAIQVPDLDPEIEGWKVVGRRNKNKKMKIQDDAV